MNEADAWLKVAEKARLLRESLLILREQMESQEKTWRKVKEELGAVRRYDEDIR